jgi:hypothetical protein
MIAGGYLDATGYYAVFLVAKDGTLTSFALPTTTLILQQLGINSGGAIEGHYYDLSFNPVSFVRTANGTISTFTVPGSAFTCPSGIDPAGAIAGSYYDASFTSHGFLRAKDGTITTIDPSGSTGTTINGISTAGAVTGYYRDASFVAHGFVWSK